MGRGTASGPMGEAVDHSLSQTEPADMRALVTYLHSRGCLIRAGDDSVAGALIAERRRRSCRALGRKVFEQACASCHSSSYSACETTPASLSSAPGLE